MSAKNRQKLRSLGLIFVWVVIVAMALAFAPSCGGGGEDAIVAPPEELEDEEGRVSNRPIIVTISPRVASPGQTITIAGLYFGDEEEADSMVTLGGRPFTVVSWSDETIEATVPQNATSGIVVVTVGTLSSQSGTNAQLFIGESPPTGTPLIVHLSDDTASVGSRITVYGFNFGASRGDSVVTFAGKDGARIPATVVTETVNGESREQWSNTSIQVIVPAGEPGTPTVTGPVIVTVNGVDSNSNFYFNPLPAMPGTNAPIVTGISPENGPSGTTVTITGINFGYSRGVSIVTIGGLRLQVVSWSDTEIVAIIPQGATTNLIRVLIGGLAAESPHAFVVDAVPFLSAVVPEVLQVGQGMKIYGRDFGSSPGSVIFTPQSEAPGQSTTTVSGTSITSWSDSAIEIAHLPSLNSDAGVPLKVTVRTGGGVPQVSSNYITVSVYSPVQVTLNVDYTTGVAGDTEFTFDVGVGGGSAPYDVSIQFGDERSESVGDINNTKTFTHTYLSAGSYTPSVRVTDATGNRSTITGDTITIVGLAEPVIRDVSIVELDTGASNEFRPNAEVGEYFGYYLGQVFNFDESFIPILDDPSVGLAGMETYAKRQWPLFILEGRPYAYRVGGGSLVQIEGFNLLAGQLPGGHGHILQLNYTGTPYTVASGSFAMWGDDFIRFRVPDVPNPISGDIGIVFDAVSGKDPIVSPTKLVAAPVLTDYTPNSPHMDQKITITLNDGVPPQVGDFVGTKAYLFWTFPATIDGGGAWQFDRDGDGDNDNYLLPVGYPITILPGQTSITFDLNRIYQDAPYPARDPGAGVVGVVGVVPAPGTWEVFLWVGSKSGAFKGVFANSGIVSNDLAIVNVQQP